MISRFINRLLYKWYSLKERIVRFFVYGRNGYKSFDFECSYFYQDTHLRLSRCYDTFKNHGHLMWNSNIEYKGMRKLRECIVLAERLSDDEFTSKYVYKVMEKWKRFDGGLSNINNEDLTEEQRDLYSKEFKRASKKDQIIYNSQKKRFFYLLEKYLNGWWD